MKKIFVGVILVVLIVIFSNTVILGTNTTVLEEDNKRDFLTMKEENKSKLDEYVQKYDSEAYGLAAYILNIVRWYSIPICFIGIVVGALNQYVLGTRRLDKKHKGYGLIMTFTTLLVFCQVLPLIFTIVVIGWRG